ncbi:MAG: glycosyltransferase [Legionella sp.]|nr:glycosyltransferase [Legionella sp.]
MRVSICVITYNHEPYIRRCLESLVMQETDFDIEIVIRDDGSKDNTQAIINDFQKRYPDKVRFLHSSSNLGMTANLMTVFEAAKGEYLAICEGDDYWIDPKKLQKQVLALEKYPGADLCCHPALVVGIKNNQQRKKYIGAYATNTTMIPAYEVIKADGGFIATPSIMIRKTCLQQLPSWFLAVPIADYFIQVFGALRGGCVFLPEPMAAYQQYATGSWSSAMRVDLQKKQIFLKQYLVYLKKLQTYINADFSLCCHQTQAISFCSLALVFLGMGRHTDFRKTIEQSWAYYSKVSGPQVFFFYLRFFPKFAKLFYWLHRKYR